MLSKFFINHRTVRWKSCHQVGKAKHYACSEKLFLLLLLLRLASEEQRKSATYLPPLPLLLLLFGVCKKEENLLFLLKGYKFAFTKERTNDRTNEWGLLFLCWWKWIICLWKRGGHGSGGKRRNEGSKKHFDFFKNSNLKEIGAKYNNLCTY